MSGGADAYHPPRTRGPYPTSGWEADTNRMSLSVGAPGPSFKQLSDGSYENSDPAPSWEDFFGQPMRGSDKIPRSQELYDLPDAYYGRNLYLSTVLVNQITEDEAYFVREVLPWEQADGKLSLTWDEWIFNNHLVDRQPEESVSRLLTSQKTSGTFHFQRYGIGFMLEHGFMKTREGVINYAMNIQQIKNAVVETMCLGVAVTLLTCPAPIDPYNKFPGVGPLNQHQFERRIQDEIDMFGIVHKSDNGFYVAYDRMKKVMKERGVTNANYMIIPDGVSKYVSMVPSQTIALYSGKTNNGGPGSGILNNSIYSGLTIRESRPFMMGEQRPNWDPFFHIAVIGGYNHNLAHHLRGVPVEEYRSEFRDRFIYDEGRDDEVRITLAHDLENCGLFDFSAAPEVEENYRTSYNGRPGVGPAHSQNYSSSVRTFSNVPLTQLGLEYFMRYPSYYELLEQSGTLDDILKMLACNESLLLELEKMLGASIRASSPDPPSYSLHPTRHNQVTRQQFDAFVRTAASDNSATPSQTFSSFVPSFAGGQSSQSLGSFGQLPSLAASTTPSAPPLSSISSLPLASSSQLAFAPLTFQSTGPALTSQASSTSASSSASQRSVYTGGLGAAQSSGVPGGSAAPSAPASALLAAANGFGNLGGFGSPPAQSQPLSQPPQPPQSQPQSQSKPASFVLEIFEIANQLENVCISRNTWLNPVHTKADKANLKTVATSARTSLLTSGVFPVILALGAVGSAVDDFLEIEEDISMQSGNTPDLPYVPLFSLSDQVVPDYRLRSFIVTGATKPGAVQIVQDANARTFPATKLSTAPTSTEKAAIDRLWAIAGPDIQISKPQDLTLSDVTEIKNVLAKAHADGWVNAANEVNPLACPYYAIGIMAAACKVAALSEVNTIMVDQYTAKIADAFSELRTYMADAVRHPRGITVGGHHSHERIRVVNPSNSNQVVEVDSRVNAGFRYNADAAKAFFKYLRSKPAVGMQKMGQDISTSYADVILDVMAAYHDKLADVNQYVGYWLLLLAFLEQCSQGRKSKEWKEWADGVIFDYVSESPVNEDIFKFAHDKMSPFRTEHKLRLSHELVEKITERGPTCDLAQDLSELINSQKAAKQTAFKAAAAKINTLVPGVASGSGSDSGSGSGSSGSGTAAFAPAKQGCTCVKCPCSCAHAQQVRDELVKVFKNKQIREGTFFWWCYKRNLPCPLGFICFRPMMRYTMGTALLMVPGRATGSSYMSHADFQLGDDVTRKMHVGNFTFYAKPAIRVPKNIAFAPNIYSTDYNGGNGTNYWQYDELDRDRLRNGDIEDRDMFCMAVPLEWEPKRRFIDMVGCYDPEICNDVNDGSELHFPTARLYASYWGFAHQRGGVRPDPTDRTLDQNPLTNTLCAQDHQRMFVYHGDSKGRFENVITNKGHWGERVYQGCARVRRGMDTHLAPVPYANTSTIAIVT